jgi:hypothetical protein
MIVRILLAAGAFALWAHGALAVAATPAPFPVLDRAGKDVGLFRESHALVVGVFDYTAGWPDLPGVARDTDAVAKALEAQGFSVEVVRNPTAERLQQAYREFIGRHGLVAENRLLFWFAGHGYTERKSYGGDVGYIVPADAPLPDRDRAAFLDKALSMQQMEVYARSIDARHALFLFDSCFSGQLFSVNRAVPDHITYKTALPVRQFITSGSAEEQVPDRSIFREQFEEALRGEADRNEDGYVTGAELGEFLQEKVLYYSRGSQHPQYGKIRDTALDKGDFVFGVAQRGTAGPPAAAVAEPQRGGAREGRLPGFWRLVSVDGDRADSLTYLLLPDGKGAIEEEDADGGWWSAPLRWALEGGLLTVSYEEQRQSYAVVETLPDSLVLRGESGERRGEELRFGRIAEAEALGSQADVRPEQLHGTWRDTWESGGKPGWAEFQFRADGGGQERGEEGTDRWSDPFRWTWDGKALRLAADGEERAYRVRRLTPDRLDLFGTGPGNFGEGTSLRKASPGSR